MVTDLLERHRFDHRFRHSAQILLHGQLREDAFERRRIHQLAELRGRIVGDDAALAEDDDARADALDRVELVRTVENDAAILGERFDDGAEHERGGDVEARDRFVEDNDARVVQQRRRQQDLLAHAFGEGCQRRVIVGVEAEDLQKFRNLTLEPVLGNAAKAACQPQILRTCEVIVCNFR